MLDVSRKRLPERAIVNFQALGDQINPQEDHTGDCLKELSLPFKLLLIEQITGDLAERYLIPNALGAYRPGRTYKINIIKPMQHDF